MTGKTHLLAGANLAGWSFWLLSQGAFVPWWPVLGALGGLLPDLDASESELQNMSFRVGRRGPRIQLFKIPGVIAHALFGHRGLLHSLLALAILILGLGLFRVPTEFIACVALGYASHLLLDALTPSGIPALYPAPARLRLSPFLKIKTGGLVDQLLFLLFSLGLVGLVALAAQTFSLPKPYA